MPLRQINALTENPNGLPMQIAGRYSRVIGASITRAWENVRDWEHLPFLHADSFSECRLEEEGAWGWRAVTKGAGRTANQTTVIELAIDLNASRYVSRTLEGGLAGVEIWTRLAKRGPHETGVEVEFHLPHLTEAQAAKAAQNLVTLYTKLWDEDETMMIARQRALDERDGQMHEPVQLGQLDDLPRLIETGNGPVCIRKFQDKIIAYPARCPHLKAPLHQAEPDANGIITCPWHGYRFDIQTGRSSDGRLLKLGTMPRIEISDGKATLYWQTQKSPA